MPVSAFEKTKQREVEGMFTNVHLQQFLVKTLCTNAWLCTFIQQN